MSGAGFSWQDLDAAASEFNKHAYLIQQFLSLVRTAYIVQVKAVTRTGAVAGFGFVDVLPLVKLMDANWNASEHSTVEELPFFRLQGGSNAIIIDPQVGDIGLAVIADRDVSSVKATQAQANPGSRRRFDFADGFYFGGFLNVVPIQYLQINDDGVNLVDKWGNQINMASNGVTINGVLIDRSKNVSAVAKLTTTDTYSLGGGAQALKRADGSDTTKGTAT